MRAVSRPIRIVSTFLPLHFLEICEVVFVFSETKEYFDNWTTNVINYFYICVIKIGYCYGEQ